MLLDFSPGDHMPWWLSWFALACTLGVFGYTFRQAIRELSRQRQARRDADSLHEEGATLRLGAQHVAGVVELDEGVEFAARVEIRQRGSQRKGSKGGYSHSWREESRRCFSRPFWIRHASGERVMVEEAAEVHLVDRLDMTVHDEPYERYRIAELSRGEEVVAEGRLERMHDPGSKSGYREAGQLWVLRPIRGVERLHLSAEALSERHRRRSRRIFRGLVFGCVPLLACASALVSSFVARALIGQEEVALVERTEHYTTRGSKGSIHHHYDVHYVNAAGEHRMDSLDSDDFDEVAEGSRMALVVVPGWPAAQCLGSHATLVGIAGTLAFLLALGAYGVLSTTMRTDWYDERTKWNEGGSGKLAAPRPSTTRVCSRES